MNVSQFLVVGSTVLYDYIFTVDQLPHPGSVATIEIQSRDNIDCRFKGGTAFNIACQLALLGKPVKLIHPVGEDFYGSAYEQKLLGLNISLDHLISTLEERSGYAILFVAPDGSTLLFSTQMQVLSPQINSSVLNETYAVVLTPVIGPIHEKIIEQAGLKDIPLVLVGIGTSDVVELLPSCIMVSINQQEGKNLFQATGDESLEQLSERIPGVLFVTRGDQGCLVFKGGQLIGKVDIIPSKRTLDPTGAGDAFAAAALAGLTMGYSPVQAAQIGTATASYIVEAFGSQTNMPNWDQIASKLMLISPQTAELIRRTQRKGLTSDEGFVR